MIHSPCPSCGRAMKAVNRLAGKTRTCPGCRAETPVPAESTIAPPTETGAKESRENLAENELDAGGDDIMDMK